MLGKDIREPYAIIPAEPSGISMVLFLFAAKPDMEDKNRIKTAREVRKNDVIKVSLFSIVLSMGNFFRAAWTRTLRLESDIFHYGPMLFAAAGACQRARRLDFDHRRGIKFFERRNNHSNIMQEWREVDE